MATATARTQTIPARQVRDRVQEIAAPEQLARALGWFSVGLGLAEIAAHRGLAEMIGVDDHPVLLRAFGMRELASGIGILSQRRPAGWLWSRVAGDALDLTCLGIAFLRARGGQRGRVLAAALAVGGVTALDVICSLQLSRRAD